MLYNEVTGNFIEELNSGNSRKVKYLYSSSEIKIWPAEWILAIIILFFAVEWFVRKRKGLL